LESVCVVKQCRPLKQKAENKSDPFPEFSANVESLRHQGLYRKERLVNARSGAEIEIDGTRLINFCSNDYLGLASHPKIIRAMQTAADKFGTGSSASALVSGKSALHEKLEEHIAVCTGRDRALVLSCGYMANLALFSGLISSRGQAIFADRLCHASMIDGAMASVARTRRYKHASVASLENMLNESNSNSKLVLTESVFSMNGDIAPLPVLVNSCRRHDALLVVDDAHGFGVIGKNGLGGMDHFSLGQSDVPLMMATFGKAMGGYGAFVAGPEALIETFVQRARPYIYSTALPVPVVAAALASLQVQAEEPGRRIYLHELILQFRTGVSQLGIETMPSITPIQPVIIGSANKAISASKFLESKGIYVSAIRPPTVPENSSRLRITLSAAHSRDQVNYLLDSLYECLTCAAE